MTLSHERTFAVVLCIRSDSPSGDAPNELPPEQRDKPSRAQIQSIVSQHGGLLTPLGSGAGLAEFENAERAIECARSITVTGRHGDTPDSAGVRFGLHTISLGSAQDGEGKPTDHIAEHLAEQAHAYELRLSGIVHDAIDTKKIPVDLVGEIELSGISAPIRVYRLSLSGGPARTSQRLLPFEWSQAVAFGVLALLVSGVIFLALMVKEQKQSEMVPEAIIQPPPEPVTEPVPIPADQRPIAVLRFATTQGADAIDDYLLVGLTEDIAAALMGAENAPFIPLHRTLALPAESNEPSVAAGMLGARFVISTIGARSTDGLVFDVSVYDAESQDVMASGHTEYPEHELPNIGELLAEKIGPILNIATTARRQMQYGARIAEAYDLLLRSRHAARTPTRESYEAAHEGFRRALVIEPEISMAHAHLALLELAIAHYGWSDDRRLSLDRAVDHAQEAVALNASDPLSHLALGRAQLWNRGQLDIAIKAFERALEISPGDSAARAGLGFAQTWSGNPEAAFAHLEAVSKQTPDYPPALPWYLGHAYFVLERFDDAITVLRRFTERRPVHFPAHLLLAAALGQSGRTDEGEAVLAALFQSQGDATRSAFANVRDVPYRNPADMERYFAGLKKVGWQQ